MTAYDIHTLLSKFEELAGAIFDEKVAEQKIKPTVYATNLAEFETEEMAELSGEAPITHHKFRDFLRWLDDYFYTHGIETSQNGFLAFNETAKAWLPYTTKAEVDENPYLYYGDSESDYPDATDRVNFNGYWYACGLYSRTLEIGNYQFFRGGSPTGSLLNIRNLSDDYTQPRIIHPNEVTLSLSIVDTDGADYQVMNLYNTKNGLMMGIRMMAKDTATTFRPFYIEYYYDSQHIYQALRVLPRTTKTANDTEILIGNVLSLKDSETWLSRDDNGNMVFRDIISDTDVYTLAYLAKRLSLGTAVSGLSIDADTYKLSLALASTTSAGACPQLPGNTTTFLRGDGSFATAGFTPSCKHLYAASAANGSFYGGQYTSNDLTTYVSITEAGTYQVCLGGLSNNDSTGNNYTIAIAIDGTPYTDATTTVPTGVIPFSLSFAIELSAGAQVKLMVCPNVGTSLANATFTNMYLIVNRIS
jgi:hypothetical protein